MEILTVSKLLKNFEIKENYDNLSDLQILVDGIRDGDYHSLELLSQIVEGSFGVESGNRFDFDYINMGDLW